MVRCSIPGCHNYQGKKEFENNPKFFCFPKNDVLCEEWLRLCGRTDINTKIARICSEHFGENDWKLKDILLNVPLEKRRLKEGAIPSINLNLSTEKTSRAESIRQIEQKELVEQALSVYDKRYTMEISNHFAEPEVDVPKTVRRPGRDTIIEQYDPLAETGPEVGKLTKENRGLRRHMQRLKRRLHQAETVISSLEEVFSEGQMKRIRRPYRKYKWSYEDITFAASLYSAGPSAYAQLIKKNYPFPSPVMLKKWATALKLCPGILSKVMKRLSGFKYDEADKLCILSFHEVMLKVVSPEEAADVGLLPYKTAQAFVVRGLMSDWKHIIYYNYDCAKPKLVVTDVIQALKEINFTVVALVSGVGHHKLPLWVDMEIDNNRPYVEVISGEKVFFFGNVPNLIKNFRNCFVETGFVMNDKYVNVNPLKELLDPSMPDLGISCVLTETHISSSKMARQSPELAWQLLTQAVADALRKSVSLGKNYSPNAIECSDLIQLFGDWLDVFNAKCTTEEKPGDSLAYGLALEEQNEIISLMDDLMKNISRPKSKTYAPFQKGIILNNASLIQLREYLLQKYNIGYVVTNRFNQDDLEQSLKIRRAGSGVGGKPTALEFKYRINAAVNNDLNEIKTN